MRNAVNWLLESATWKTYTAKQKQKHFVQSKFHNSTVPKIEGRDISSKELKHSSQLACLFEEVFYMKNYVWKIERGKLGKLHIHLQPTLSFITENCEIVGTVC